MNNKTAAVVALACGLLFFGAVSTAEAQDFGFGAPTTDASAEDGGKQALSAGGSLSFSLLAFPFA
ncbi:MAG TPA: hypothetical protein VN437_01960, partial [Rectinemataceae bacterium]|nr:hypothetical protein [Rectinemataceae bacterium]